MQNLHCVFPYYFIHALIFYSFVPVFQKGELEEMDYKTDRERICRCAMNMIFIHKPSVGQAMIDYLGSAEAVFNMDKDSLDEVLGPFSEHRHKINAAALDAAAEELHKLEKCGEGAYFIHNGDSAYPGLLRECEDSPIGLYIKTKQNPDEIFRGCESVAVVGTRDISPYGRDWCEKLVYALAGCEQKPCIVSGLALGTDICAHESALKSGLPTIAVMANGIDSVYPPRHYRAAERIAESEGSCLVSEYPMGTSPLALNFLRRNRIIAGMAKACIIIESKIRGGAMTTGRLAFSYSRDVFALPGRVDDIRSQGCNRLIQEKVAESISDCGELIKNLGFSSTRTEISRPFEAKEEIRRKSSTMPEDRISRAAELLIHIKENRGISFSELSRVSGMPYREVCALCMALEKDGIIVTDILQRCRIDNGE